ncbi:hypothetical protein ACTFIW_008830 [Dictyostelium discoideum]
MVFILLKWVVITRKCKSFTNIRHAKSKGILKWIIPIRSNSTRSRYYVNVAPFGTPEGISVSSNIQVSLSVSHSRQWRLGSIIPHSSKCQVRDFTLVNNLKLMEWEGNHLQIKTIRSGRKQAFGKAKVSPTIKRAAEVTSASDDAIAVQVKSKNTPRPTEDDDDVYTTENTDVSDAEVKEKEPKKSKYNSIET